VDAFKQRETDRLRRDGAQPLPHAGIDQFRHNSLQPRRALRMPGKIVLLEERVV